MKPNADDVPIVQYTVRAPCRACGRPYVWPKGSKAPGGIGPCCQAPLDGVAEGSPDALESDLGERADDPSATPPTGPPLDAGHLGLADVLCAGCRRRPADGRLDGAPLCVGCADETIDHWLAWLDDPSHDWWPSDDPFGSARHPVAGWRDTTPL